jgi:enoyl-CoA hydratase/carnithine racemase
VARHLPPGEAMRMATTGEPISAQRAYELGMVQEVVPRAELHETAARYANVLAAAPREAIRATKRAIIEGIDLPVEQGLVLERRLAAAVRAGNGSPR